MIRLQTHLDRRPLDTGNTIIPFSISFGVVSTETIDIPSAKMVLKMADNPLYQMKKEKNHEVFRNLNSQS